MIQLCTLYLQRCVQERRNKKRRNVKQKIVAFVLSTDHRPIRLATNVCSRTRVQQAFRAYMTARPAEGQDADVRRRPGKPRPPG